MKRNLQVRDLMTERPCVIGPDDDLATVRDLMYERHVRHLPVVNAEGELVGLVSHRDLLRLSVVDQPDLPPFVEQELLARLRAQDVMVSCVERVSPDTDLQEAAQIMYENKFGCLPVVEGERLVGIITEADFVRFLGTSHQSR